MTREAIKMFKEGDFTPDAIKDLHISYDSMFTQVRLGEDQDDEADAQTRSRRFQLLSRTPT